MFVFLLEVLMGKEGAGQSGPFFTLPERKRRSRKCPTKATFPPTLRPTLGPPVAERLITMPAVVPTPSPLPTDQMDLCPPNPVTLS